MWHYLGLLMRSDYAVFRPPPFAKSEERGTRPSNSCWLADGGRSRAIQQGLRGFFDFGDHGTAAPYTHVAGGF
jgi:hypothetical protein